MRDLQNISSGNSSELLSTKLAVPRVRPSMVPRQRLLSALDTGLERKLTLLSAPAGFGKTTLVSEWIAYHAASNPTPHTRFSAAWISLDSGDNDPVRFWRYVLTACRRFDENIGTDALNLLASPPQFTFDSSQPLPIEAILTSFLNDLAQLSHPCVLVLEDYHLITSAYINISMAFLLDHLPEMAHLVIITRSDPPLPLARLRAHSDILEFRATELRFSLDDTHTFLKQALSFPITSEVTARLQERTEGWAVGLNLLSLALQGRTDSQEREHFIETFTGGYRHIVEYLVGDVLNAQPEPVQTFLLQTSVLSRLTAPLCDAVTGKSDSQALLEDLERANLFLVPLDGSGEWYRYHALFTEAMQHEARRRLGESALAECHARASHWYEQHGLPNEAIEAALSAQDYEHAAILIEGRTDFQKYVQVYEYYTLIRWMKKLPEETIRAHPSLCFTSAFLLILDETTPQAATIADERLSVAERAFRANGNYTQLGGIYALRALKAVWDGAISKMIAYARQALDLLPPEEMIWRSSCLSFIGAEEVLEGKYKNARQSLLKGRSLGESGVNRYAIRPINIALGQVYFGLGELHQAADLYRQVIEEADEDKDYYDKGQGILGMARLSYEWNDLDLAGQQGREAYDLCKQNASHPSDEILEMRAAIVMAQVLHAQGRTEQALQQLASLPTRSTSEQVYLIHREVLTWQALFSLDSGELSAAQRWAAYRDHPAEILPRSTRESESLVEARLHIALAEPTQALELLEPYLAFAYEDGRIARAIELHLVIARAYQQLEQDGKALESLRNALTLAHPEGFRRTFLDEGEPIETLLRSLLLEVEDPTLTTYIHILLQAFASDKTRPTPQAQSEPTASTPPPNEPLSVQEQRVLRLFAAGLSRQEIAGELVVSVNTVKTHLQRIYRKLAVTNRPEAREAARRLNLL